MTIQFRRFRPLRTDEVTRNNNADVALNKSDLIMPHFVVEGEMKTDDPRRTIPSMPGICRQSVGELADNVGRGLESGINKVLLFGVVDDLRKTEDGSYAYAEDNIVCQAVGELKRQYPSLTIITDVCLCGYTTHGHCGLLRGREIDNDSTLPLLAQMAYVHALAGADIVAPSAMMDGQVSAIRSRLQQDERTANAKVMGYSAKYASAFYGPFRDAAGSAPSFGDRRSYQMDYRNRSQGIEEIEADIDEGAAYVMVKPAMPYLDVVARAKDKFPNVPMVAYQVSGEYSMLSLARQQNLLSEAGITESLYAIKRAGADLIITYFAYEVAKHL